MIKKHKGLIICLVILLILGIIAFIGLKNLVYPDSNKSKYGDRLNGIENHVISDETFNEMKESFLKNENVISFDYVKPGAGKGEAGKIIKIFIKVKQDTKVDTSKELSDIIVKNLSDEDKAFYDISYYVTCEGENSLYPILGSKHKTSEIFSWTERIEREEEITQEEEPQEEESGV